jgi:hypothetical protein
MVWLTGVLPQLLLTVYVMTALPGVTPVTTPLAGSTVAIDGDWLLQVPPLTPSL